MSTTQNIKIKRCELHFALCSFIRHIVLIDADFGKAPVNLIGNMMPSPDQAMFINIFTRFKSKRTDESDFNISTSCTLIGPQITPVKLLVEESHKAISVIFQPGGLNRFLGIPMSELFDNGYSAREIIGKEIDELLDKCHDIVSLDDLDSIIQKFFLRKLSYVKEELPIDFALQYLATNYNTDIDQIAAMACMSVRTFERKCKERLGMPAKMYARIARFHKAYKLLENKQAPTWTDLAHGAGYYDQMHFIKDFKEFAGVTPTLVQRELSGEHIQFHLDWNSI